MTRSLVSIEVWKDSGSSAVVSVYQAGKRIDRVTVIAGDCLDLELDDGMSAMLMATPAADEAAEELRAQDAIAEREAV